MLRTIAVFHSGDDTGPARTFEPRVRALAELGSTTVVFPRPGSAADRYATFTPVEVVPYRRLVIPRSFAETALLGPSFVADTTRLTAAFRRLQPSVVICVTSVVPAVLVAARLSRVPSILYAAELQEGRSARLVQAIVDRLASTTVACSHTVAAHFRQAQVVYPGLVLDRPRPSSAEARGSFAIGEDAFVVAAVGNISRGRGQDVLVDAVAALEGEVVCLLAGDPHPRRLDLEYRDELLSRAHRLGLGDRVRLLGHVDDVERVYAAANVVVNPARRPEAFGRAGAEAVAAGRPVVASGVGALPEVLGDVATIVPPADPGALAAALRALRAAPPDDAILQERRRRVAARFAEPGQTAAFVEAVLDVTGRRGAGPPAAVRAPRDTG